MPKTYSLPNLDYSYNALEPYISEKQLTIHHTKHHQGYVNGANTAFADLEKARQQGTEMDMKATLKNLSFNVSGHILHSLFWNNMAPKDQSGQPNSALIQAFENEFGSVERFKSEFNAAAVSVEGSGWAATCYDPMTDRIIISQIEKHNANLYPMLRLLLVVDVWEHAYYLDYKNDRAGFLAKWWDIINWEEVNKRYKKAVK